MELKVFVFLFNPQGSKMTRTPIALAMPQVMAYENEFYVTIHTSVYQDNREIFFAELVKDSVANMEEIELFEKYKERLKQ